MKCRSLLLALLLLPPAPALARGAESDDKLPAKLPAVTVTGTDLSRGGDGGTGKLLPTAGASTPGVRLPEPEARRAIRENNRTLMVMVTPSTLEPAPPLAAPALPYTSLLAGYGPLTQFQLGLYDARLWGPTLGISRLDGRSGWGWSLWQGKEALDWPGIGRVSMEGESFAWQKGAHQGSQSDFDAGIEHGEGEDLLFGARFTGGAMAGAVPLSAWQGGLNGQYRFLMGDEHKLTLQGHGQYRRWGSQASPEGYASVSDFWSLSDRLQIEAGMGGGYWGFEPLLNPSLALHYRPESATHCYASLRSVSELPDFAALYGRRLARAGADNLQSERVEGWAEVGASHRLNDLVWGSVSAGLRRSQRHIYWADLSGLGLWTPANAQTLQWQPLADARLQFQWAPQLSQLLTYRYRAAHPLDSSEHALATSLEATLLEQRLGVSIGLDGRLANLSPQQSPQGGSGRGLFAEAEVRYALTPDWSLSFTAADVPLLLGQPAVNFFAPAPMLSANVQYQF